MENKTLSIQLIENRYDREDSLLLLNKILDDKIEIVEEQIQTLHRKYGLTSNYLDNRLTYLKHSKLELADFLSEELADEYEVVIDCPVHIELRNLVTRKAVRQEENIMQ